MLKPTTLYSEAKRRLDELRSVRDRLISKLEKAPPGKPCIRLIRGHARCYIRLSPNDRNGKYVPKSDSSRLKKYFEKAYFDRILEEIDTEIYSLENLLKKSENASNHIKQIYSNYPIEIKQSIKPIDCSDEDYAKEWLSQPYIPKEISDDVPVFRTDKGELVRSKSELNIANALFKHNIPYKYEYPVILKNGIIVHPDFVVLKTSERKEIFWEHRGMMGDSQYAEKSVKKIKSYSRIGIVIGDNLIITEETGNYPLGTDEIENVINRVILGK